MNKVPWWKRRRKRDSWPTDELVQLIADSHVEAMAKQEMAIERWSLGSAGRWNADLEQGTISFTFADHVVTGEVQVIGSYALTAGTWLWGWANQSIPEPVTRAAQSVPALAAREGLGILGEPQLSMPAEMADDFAMIAVKAADLDGWYRGPTSDKYLYLGFRNLTVVTESPVRGQSSRQD